jgi:hypothetical protein
MLVAFLSCNVESSLPLIICCPNPALRDRYVNRLDSGMSQGYNGRTRCTEFKKRLDDLDRRPVPSGLMERGVCKSSRVECIILVFPI